MHQREKRKLKRPETKSDFRTNLHTVNKAYELLEHEGFLLLKCKTSAVIQIKQRLAEDRDARLRTLLAETYERRVSHQELSQRSQRILEDFVE